MAEQLPRFILSVHGGLLRVDGTFCDGCTLDRSARSRRRDPDEVATRVFLLGDLHETAFRKGTKGGMIGSKQYFDISELGVENAEQLAEALQGREWSELKD